MQDAQPVVLTGEALLSAFHTLSAEADLLLLKGYFHASITIYTKALALVPDDKHCLVSRAKCYIQSGSPALALQDSNTVIEIYPDFFKGVFWKAEALYAQGDFEQSLVYYHRGSSIKPEFPEFRIGIQKATEAIENSIGDPNVRIRVNEDSRRYWVPQCIDSEFKKPVGEFHHATLQRAVTENKPANTQNKKVNQSGMTPAMEKLLLGNLYSDKEYLNDMRNDRDLKNYPDTTVNGLVDEGLVFLDNRLDFWKQQNPIYARRNNKPCKSARKI